MFKVLLQQFGESLNSLWTNCETNEAYMQSDLANKC